MSTERGNGMGAGYLWDNPCRKQCEFRYLYDLRLAQCTSPCASKLCRAQNAAAIKAVEACQRTLCGTTVGRAPLNPVPAPTESCLR